MPEVVAARDAYKAVEQQIVDLRTRARARLGCASLHERTALGKTQKDVADKLGVTVEQVRRYEATWRSWQREHPGEKP